MRPEEVSRRASVGINDERSYECDIRTGYR